MYWSTHKYEHEYVSVFRSVFVFHFLCSNSSVSARTDSNHVSNDRDRTTQAILFWFHLCFRFLCVFSNILQYFAAASMQIQITLYEFRSCQNSSFTRIEIDRKLHRNGITRAEHTHTHTHSIANRRTFAWVRLRIISHAKQNCIRIRMRRRRK